MIERLLRLPVDFTATRHSYFPLSSSVKFRMCSPLSATSVSRISLSFVLFYERTNLGFREKHENIREVAVQVRKDESRRHRQDGRKTKGTKETGSKRKKELGMGFGDTYCKRRLWFVCSPESPKSWLTLDKRTIRCRLPLFVWCVNLARSCWICHLLLEENKGGI